MIIVPPFIYTFPSAQTVALQPSKDLTSWKGRGWVFGGRTLLSLMIFVSSCHWDFWFSVLQENNFHDGHITHEANMKIIISNMVHLCWSKISFLSLSTFDRWSFGRWWCMSQSIWKLKCLCWVSYLRNKTTSKSFTTLTLSNITW